MHSYYSVPPHTLILQRCVSSSSSLLFKLICLQFCIKHKQSHPYVALSNKQLICNVHNILIEQIKTKGKSCIHAVINSYFKCVLLSGLVVKDTLDELNVSKGIHLKANDRTQSDLVVSWRVVSRLKNINKNPHIP